MRSEMQRYLIPVLVAAVGLVVPAQSTADEPEYPNGLPFQALEDDLDSVIGALESLQSGLGDLTNVLEVEISINPVACSSLPVQCAEFGYVDPAEGNDSPLQLVASVSRSGVPVTGLEFEDFTFHSGPVAPGGAAVQFCTDAHQGDSTCGASYFFEAGAGGTYNMWLRPYNFQDWDDGFYAGTLAVSDADGNGIALVSFSIE